jgi:hypothetical protein
VEGSPLLLDFGAPAFWARDLVFVVFRDAHHDGKLFIAGLAKVFVVGHGFLPEKLDRSSRILTS